MKKKALTFTLAASVVALAACSGGDSSDLVTSKDFGKITTAEFNDMSKQLTGPFVLKQMITEKVLADKYEVSKEEVDEAFKPVEEQYGDELNSALAANGLTADGFKDSLRLQLLQNKALQEHAVTDEEVKKIYEQGKQELNGRHILVEDEETAQKAIKEIKDGASFGDVAKKYSTDPGSKEKGGELGWFSQGTMLESFNDAAYALELNKVSEPVASDFGFHVIEITDKRDVKDYPKFEDKENEIREGLVEKMMQTGEAQVVLDEVVGKMLKKADFKTEDPLLKDALNLFTNGPEAQAEEKADDAKEQPAEEPAKEEKKEDKK
ncbi:MAG TPA: peptidylprolyl isomerase [Metalysinibacillus sp.]